MTPTQRRWPELFLPVVAGLLFLSPMLLTDRSFGPDWGNHLWLIQVQADAIKELGHPSRFFGATGVGAMYPHYAFYGSTWYSTVAGLSVLTGGATTAAYIASYGVAFAGAYFGWWWLARELGVRGLAAHAPALIYSFAAFRIVDAYAGGAYSEFVGPSAIPLIAAAAIHLLRAPRLRALPALALVVGVIWMTGSHNITLVWGSVTLALLTVVALAALPRRGRELAPRRIVAVLGLAALSAAVNAWFLLPDVTYAGKMRASLWGYDMFKGNAEPLNTLSNIFDPIYHNPLPDGIAGLYVQLPVLALLWALIVVLGWRREAVAGPWWRAGVGLLAVFVLLLVLIVGDDTWVWSVVPEPLRFVQFPHRLHAYTVLLTAGFVLVALAGLARTRTPERSRVALISLAAVCLLLTGVGTWQIWSTKDSLPNREAVFASSVTQPPATWYDAGAYRDNSEPVVDTAQHRHVDFPITPDAWAGFDLQIDVPKGSQPFATNLAAGPYLVKVTGLRRLGRTSQGFAVLAREQGATATGPVRVSIRPADGLAVTAGTAITLAALITLAGWLSVLVVRERGPAPRRAEVLS
jgi:hypothetical protein